MLAGAMPHSSRSRQKFLYILLLAVLIFNAAELFLYTMGIFTGVIPLHYDAADRFCLGARLYISLVQQ